MHAFYKVRTFRLYLCTPLSKRSKTETAQTIGQLLASGTGSQSPPGTPTTLVRHPLPSSIPPRQSTAPVPQARPILAPQPSFSTPQIPFQARVPVNQPLPAPSFPPPVPLPGPQSFTVPKPLVPPAHSFKSPAALPLAQPAIPEGPRNSQQLPVEATPPPGRATQSGSPLPAVAPLPVQSLPLVPGGFAAPLPVPQAQEAVINSRGSRDLGRPTQGLTESRVVSGGETHGVRKEVLDTEARRPSDSLDLKPELVDNKQQQQLSGGEQHLRGLTGDIEDSASPLEASQPTNPSEGAPHSPAGQKEEQSEPSITTESFSPITRPPNSEALRPKSSHGTRSTLTPHSPEQAPDQHPSASLQPVSQQLSSNPSPQPLSRTVSISRPSPRSHPSAFEPLSSFRGVSDSTSQPSLARQASLLMQYQAPSGGMPPPPPSLTFTCGSCNNAQMLPPLPPGVHHMKCGTCGSVNEVQIRGGEAPPPSPPPQAFVSPPSMQPQYGQQEVSSPGSQGGGYGTPPSPPAQTMKCGACGSVMMLPPMEAGVHQFQCGACRAINSCQIHAPAPVQVRSCFRFLLSCEAVRTCDACAAPRTRFLGAFQSDEPVFSWEKSKAVPKENREHLW
jgi:LSD1 subclass zinc finger protein